MTTSIDTLYLNLQSLKSSLPKKTVSISSQNTNAYTQDLQTCLDQELTVIEEIFTQIFQIINSKQRGATEQIAILKSLYLDISSTEQALQTYLLLATKDDIFLKLNPNTVSPLQIFINIFTQIQTLVVALRIKIVSCLAIAIFQTNLCQDTAQIDPTLFDKQALTLQPFEHDPYYKIKLKRLNFLLQFRKTLFANVFKYCFEFNIRQLCYFNPGPQVKTALSMDFCFGDILHWGINLQIFPPKTLGSPTPVLMKLQSSVKNAKDLPAQDLFAGDSQVNDQILKIQDKQDEINTAILEEFLFLIKVKDRLSIHNSGIFKATSTWFNREDTQKTQKTSIEAVGIRLHTEGLKHLGHVIGLAKIQLPNQRIPFYRFRDPDFGEFESDNLEKLAQFLDIFLKLNENRHPFTDFSMFRIELPEMLDILEKLNIAFPLPQHSSAPAATAVKQVKSDQPTPHQPIPQKAYSSSGFTPYQDFKQQTPAPYTKAQTWPLERKELKETAYVKSAANAKPAATSKSDPGPSQDTARLPRQSMPLKPQPSKSALHPRPFR